MDRVTSRNELASFYYVMLCYVMLCYVALNVRKGLNLTICLFVLGFLTTLSIVTTILYQMTIIND